jgi:hypothetical protein
MTDRESHAGWLARSLRGMGPWYPTSRKGREKWGSRGCGGYKCTGPSSRNSKAPKPLPEAGFSTIVLRKELIGLRPSTQRLGPPLAGAWLGILISSSCPLLMTLKTLRRETSMHALERSIPFVSSRTLPVLLLLFTGSFSWAQNLSHVVVVSATKHVTTPPLSQIAPIPPREQVRSSGASSEEPGYRHSPQDLTPRPSFEANADATLTTNSGLDILGVGMGFTGYTEQGDIAVANGAAGATQFVQFVNESFAVFDKSSGRVISGPTAGHTLWQSLGAPCSTRSDLDEIAQYDKLANVWVMMMPLYTTPPYFCIAVSTTSDATGSWNLYAFEIPVNAPLCSCSPMPDYPKLGVWPDAYYIAYAESVDSVYRGPAACAVDRSAMLSGADATMQCFTDDGTSNNLWLPSDVDGTTAPASGTPNYFVNFDVNDQSLDLWQFHVDWTTPSNSTFTGPTNIPVTAFLEPCGDTVTVFTPADNCVPQAGTTEMLGVFGDRLMYRLAYRNFGSYEDLVANHSVQVASSSDQTGIRWYELRNPGSGFSVYQQGTYAPDSNYRWMGSIAMDQVGDIAVGYNVSSSSMSPTIRYTGRQSTDTLGTMETEIDILSTAGVATASQTNSVRWGDYSSMAIDPTDDCTFWYTNQYQPTNGKNEWSTRIASFSFPACSGGFALSSSASSLTVNSGNQGTVTLTVTPQGGFNSAVSFSCSGLPAGATCAFSPAQVTPSGTAVTTTLTFSVGTQSASRRVPSPFLPVAVMAAAFCLIGWRRARSPFMPMLAAVIIGLGAMSACGGGSSGGTGGGTTPTTSTVTVAATAGKLQQTTTITLTVN